jgi:adenine deaminase
MDTQTFNAEAQNAQNQVLAATGPLQQVWRQTWIEWPVMIASESLRFTAHRLRAHSSYYDELQGCGSVPEFIEAHSHFMRKAFEDYGAEATKALKDATKHVPAA